MLFLLFKLLATLFLATAAITILFHIAVKLRLAPVFIYLGFLSLSTLFSDFAHTPKAFYILLALLLISLLSWIITLTQYIRRRKEERFWEDDMMWQIRSARERGIALDSVSFDEDHNLLDPRTGKPLDWC